MDVRTTLQSASVTLVGFDERQGAGAPTLEKFRIRGHQVVKTCQSFEKDLCGKHQMNI